MGDLVSDLVAARKARGITQEEVAEAMGISQGSVSEFESSRDPRLSTIRRYAAVVGVQIRHEVIDLDEGES